MAVKREAITDGPPLVESDLPLGRPGFVVHNSLVLSGWAASPKGIAGVAIQIDDRQWNAAYGLDSPAVADRLPAVEGADRAGYHLPVDTTTWEPGQHYVTVAAFDREGGRAAVEGAVEVRPFDATVDGSAAVASDGVALELDLPLVAGEPYEVEGPLVVSGWAHASEGIEAVVVTLDGTAQYEALRPIVRPELIGQLDREAASAAGFILQFDAFDCPPGRHSLMVCAISRQGRTAGVEHEVVARSPLEQRLDAPPVDWLAERVAPRLRDGDGEPTAIEAVWESRALLAEADAARCRAEARLAQTAQELTRRELADVEADAGVLTGRLRGELAAARQSLVALRAELDRLSDPA